MFQPNSGYQPGGNYNNQGPTKYQQWGYQIARDGTVDQAFNPIPNLPAFTWALVAVGYRPYMVLDRSAKGEDVLQRVWVRRESDLEKYLPVTSQTQVYRLPVDHNTIDPDDVIIIDDQDWGDERVGFGRVVRNKRAVIR